MMIVMWIMNVKTPVIVMLEERRDEGTTQWKGARLYTREEGAGNQWRMTGRMMS